MKQSKKNKLPLASETIRSLSKPLLEDQLQEVVGGTLYTVLYSKCAYSGGICTG